MELDLGQVRETVRRALDEDLGTSGDCTTRFTVAPDRQGSARLLARRPGVLCGIEIAIETFRMLDADVAADPRRADGDVLDSGDVVLTVEGRAASLLAAERTALNFLQRLSGVATMTHAFVASVRGTTSRILDTRKTTPGLRVFEKYAVATGGGTNHRIGLFDQVLLKENHFALAGMGYREVVERAVAGARAEGQTAPVVAEARTLDEAVLAVAGGAGVVLLDNFAPGPELRAAVAAVRAEAERQGRLVETEASGGVTLATVAAFAACGVDRISIGALTHSAPALDLSMLVEGVA